MAKFGARLFEAAAGAARSNMAKRLGNEVAEWTTGQIIGQVVSPMLDPGSATNVSRIDYLQKIGGGKPGVALASMVADTVVNSLKTMYEGPSEAKAAVQSSLTQNMSMHISAALQGPQLSMPLPNTSLRESVFQLSANTIRPQSLMQQSMAQQAFDVTSVLDMGNSYQKTLLQKFYQKPSDTSEAKEPKAAAESEADKVNEDVKEVSPSRNKV